jgi:ribosomal protein S18 acetylase RimI-like enzyme
VEAAGPIEVRDLRAEEVDAAVGVLARGMRDNPLHVGAYGEDPERRLRCHARLVAGFFRHFQAQQPIVAVEDGTLVGVTGVARPGTCQPTAVQRLRLLPTMLGMGPRTAARVASWFSAWAGHDPDEPHFHLGPLAVDAHLQGRGIGSRIMEEHCRRLDAAGDLGYLETDKPENVRFYERFGFEVVGEDEVIGVQNWFMLRTPRPGG